VHISNSQKYVEGENNGYVVFKMKYPRICWNMYCMLVLRGRGVTPPAPTPFLQEASGQIYKDDVNGFSSTSDIYFTLLTQVVGGDKFRK
jgi:hypothetical protein